HVPMPTRALHRMVDLRQLKPDVSESFKPRARSARRHAHPRKRCAKVGKPLRQLFDAGRINDARILVSEKVEHEVAPVMKGVYAMEGKQRLRFEGLDAARPTIDHDKASPLLWAPPKVGGEVIRPKEGARVEVEGLRYEHGLLRRQ